MSPSASFKSQRPISVVDSPDAANTQYKLTTTIAPWLVAFGFREVGWHDLAPAVHASDELRGVCPTSARAFVSEVVAG